MIAGLAYAIACGTNKSKSEPVTSAAVDKMTDSELVKATVDVLNQIVEAAKSNNGSCDARAALMARVVTANKPLWDKIDDIEKNDEARREALEKLQEGQGGPTPSSPCSPPSRTARRTRR